MVIISFFHLWKIHIFPKLGGCGSKNELATPFWILNFKWAWQAQFLSHNLLILQNCIFFVGKQMILVSFAKIHKGIKVTNFGHSCHIHILSHPWPNVPQASNWHFFRYWWLTKLQPRKLLGFAYRTPAIRRLSINAPPKFSG